MKFNFDLNLKLSHKALILVALPLIFEFIFVGTLVFALKRLEYEVWRERHSYSVLSESQALLKNFMDTGMALYLYSTSGSDRALESYKDLSAEIPQQIHHLKVLLRDSPEPKESLARLQHVGNRVSELLAKGSEIISDARAAKRLGQDRENMPRLLSDISSELKTFKNEQEKAETVDPRAEARSRELVIYCLDFGISLNIILAVLLAIVFFRSREKTARSK